MLKGIKVLEMAGLGPSTMCGLILQDYGASVTRILNPNAPLVDNLLSPGKDLITLNLRNSDDKLKMTDLCKQADVLLDPHRPTALDRLGFSASFLHNLNKRLILVRISGYGYLDDSPNKDYYLRPGHDINYLAETGILWLFAGESNARPIPPANLIADIGGGALPAAFGTGMALFEREKTGKGKIVDVSIADGVSYMSSHFIASRQVVDAKTIPLSFSSMLWPDIKKKCANMLDGGAPFYRVYTTKDNKYIAIGALEPHFYANLLKCLGIPSSMAPQSDRVVWPRIAALFAGIFASETRAHWLERKDLVNQACLSPVWSPEEALANRPSHTYRPINFSHSPLQGGASTNGNYSLRIPTQVPKLYDFPTDGKKLEFR